MDPKKGLIHQMFNREGPRHQHLNKTDTEILIFDGVIEPAHTGWASAIVFVLKNDVSFQLFSGYQKLDDVTVRDRYPIQCIEKCIESLGDSTAVSNLDANASFRELKWTKTPRAWRAPQDIISGLDISRNLSVQRMPRAMLQWAWT